MCHLPSLYGEEQRRQFRSGPYTKNSRQHEFKCFNCLKAFDLAKNELGIQSPSTSPSRPGHCAWTACFHMFLKRGHRESPNGTEYFPSEGVEGRKSIPGYYLHVERSIGTTNTAGVRIFDKNDKIVKDERVRSCVGQFSTCATWCIASIIIQTAASKAKEFFLDILASRNYGDFVSVQECKTNANVLLESPKYHWYCSSVMKNDDREKKVNLVQVF